MHNRHGEPVPRCRQPRRYKLALLTFAGLLAPVYFVPPAVSAVFSDQHLLSVIATVAVMVALMSCVIMPVLTRLTANWLFR